MKSNKKRANTGPAPTTHNMSIKNKITLENILCLFIILCPILDMSSFLFRSYFNTSYSISTIIRPIIPIGIIIYIFFKDKIKLKLIAVGVVYGIYAIIHLYLFNTLKTEISYGTITHEFQYIINYSFMILNLFIYMYVFHQKNSASEKLKKSVLISICIYTLSIYLSIFTKTASSTYVEQIGQKGWFESGNSISAILILSMFILYTMVRDMKYNKIVITLILFTGVYLMTMLGTRVALFGFIIVTMIYAFAEIVMTLKNKMKFNKKNMVICAVLVVIVLAVVIVKGSSTLQRRKFLQNQQSDLIDISTGEPAHVTLDIVDLKEKIRKGDITEDVMSKPAQQAIMDLYRFANENEIAGTDRRTQQLVYNYYKMINEKDIKTILFGNGYLNNYAELTLEMEIPAFFLNFGVCGFILYFVPFLSMCVYAIYMGIKNAKQIDVEYITLVCGALFTFAISFFTGAVFFNSSTTIIIITMYVLLLNKVNTMKIKLLGK